MLISKDERFANAIEKQVNEPINNTIMSLYDELLLVR